MKKLFESRKKIASEPPKESILKRIWRVLAYDYDVVDRYPEVEVPLPSNILERLVHNAFVLGFPLPIELNQLLSEDCTTTEIHLPESRGGGTVLTYVGKSPKGARALAKILTRREGDYIRETFYLQTLDSCGCRCPTAAFRKCLLNP